MTYQNSLFVFFNIKVFFISYLPFRAIDAEEPPDNPTGGSSVILLKTEHPYLYLKGEMLRCFTV